MGPSTCTFGPEAPKGHESNWVQSEPDKQWFIMFRFYGTKPAVFDKSWRMGDIEALNYRPNTRGRQWVRFDPLGAPAGSDRYLREAAVADRGREVVWGEG